MFSVTFSQNQNGQPRRPPNINIIPYSIYTCLFSVFITFCIISYGTSHLAKSEIRMYYEDTKKE